MLSFPGLNSFFGGICKSQPPDDDNQDTSQQTGQIIITSIYTFLTVNNLGKLEIITSIYTFLAINKLVKLEHNSVQTLEDTREKPVSSITFLASLIA